MTRRQIKNGVAIFLVAATAVSTYFLTKPVSSLTLIESSTDSNFQELDLRTRMDLAFEQEVSRTKDPKLGFVPKNRLYKAYQEAEKRRSAIASKSKASRAPITGVNWTERGPNNVGGRTRAIMIDPNDGTNKTIWAAGVAGGLWKTTDITKANPDWEPVNDFFENMAITTLAYDPSDTDIMYFGTGEGFFNVDAIEGNGIWRSSDGGDNWTQLSTTINADRDACTGDDDCDFTNVNKIVVTSSGTILAATRSRFTNRGGIMRSTNGGTSWSNVLEGLSGTNACTASGYLDWGADLEIAANGDIYASLGIFENQGIWKSTDDGASWGSPVYTSGCTEQRIELAVAPSNEDYVYALIQEDDNTINRIIRTTNGGTSWSTLSNPFWLDQDCLSPSTDFTRNQAWYDLIAAVDPNDEETIYIGGIDIHRSTDGGSNWTQMTNWAGNCDLPEIHADQHAIIYQPGSSDVIYFGNDGGIYYTENGSATEPTFTRKEFGYNTSQFYSIAMHPTAKSPVFVGGTQDNGSHRLTDLGISSMVEVTGGDGGFAHIDQDDGDFQITSFTGITINRSFDGGQTFSNVFSISNGVFINPSDFSDNDDVIYGAYIGGQYYLSPDIKDPSPTIGSFGNIAAFNSGEVTSLTTSPNTSERVWFGLDNGRVVRVNNAASSPAATNITGSGFPTGSVSCIAVETGDDSHLLATFSNYGVTSVWETTNGGTSWTAVEGDLPDMPVRWALFNPNNSDQAMIATELGVWSTDNLNGASTEWSPSNTGLANVRTDMLQIRSSDNLVVAATHGRGVFTSDVFAAVDADFTADKNVVYAEATINFSDASYQATSWEWDFGDGGVSTEQNPSHSYKRSGKYEVTLTINGGDDTETKTDFIHVLPNLGVPFLAASGGDFESNPDYFGADDLTGGINLWERGAPGNAITTVNSGTRAWKTALSADITQADYSCALYSPNFNFTEAGTYTLSFRKSMEVAFANAPMGVQVHYSLDNGANWTRLGENDDSDGTNWYERGPGSTFSLETDVIHDRIGFSNIYSNEITDYDVSFLSGNSTVAFRFYMAVNAGYNSTGYQVDGFMIDDFAISGPVNEENVNITSSERGTAISMDGVDDYLSLSNLAVSGSFTAEMWLNPSVAGDGQSILAKHDGTGNDIFKLAYNNGGIEVTVNTDNTSGGTQTTGLQHLAVSVEQLTGSTSEVTVYRDGVQLFQSTVNDIIDDSDGLDWVVGQDWDGVATPSDYFEGSIEELRLWSTVRTADEIRQNNHLIVDGLDTDLIGYWQFNENTGTDTENAITSNIASLTGSTWSSSMAPVGTGESNTATINTDGTTVFGSGLSITFNGVSGSFDVVVFEVSDLPAGILPGDEYVLIESINNPFTIINTYGAGTFTDATLTYNYGAGAFTESDPSNVFLFKRPSTSSDSWSTVIEATSVNPATGEAVFDNITSFSQTAFGAGDEVLPVTFGGFDVIRNNGVSHLQWKTLSERDNHKFEILSSIDGKNWGNIGEVTSKGINGNSDAPLNYSFEDNSSYPGHEIFYRLKQMDFDGKFSHSPIVQIDNTYNQEKVFHLSPNPAINQLNIQISSNSIESAMVSVISLNGQTVLQQLINISTGITEQRLDISNLKSGLYIVKIQNTYFEHAQKLIIE